MDLVAIGDSKTVGWNYSHLIDILNRHDQHNDAEFSGVLATSAWTTANAADAFPAFAAAQTQTPEHVLINLGSNDVTFIGGSLSEGTWRMGELLDAIHAEWPSAKVWLMRVERTDYATERDLYDDTWIPNVLASRSSWAKVGPDERVFLAGHLQDVTHPTPEGYILTSDQWREVIVSSY